MPYGHLRAQRSAGYEPSHPEDIVSPEAMREAWYRTIYNVRTVLTNPAYLGYVVWRRRWHGRLQPRERWIWSDEPSHPALVEPEMFWTAYDLDSRPAWLTAALAETR